MLEMRKGRGRQHRQPLDAGKSRKADSWRLQKEPALLTAWAQGNGIPTFWPLELHTGVRGHGACAGLLGRPQHADAVVQMHWAPEASRQEAEGLSIPAELPGC